MSCTTQPNIPALYSVVDLQRLCIEQHVKLSPETNRYMLYTTLRKIGAVQAQKLIKKLVEKGEIKWEDNENFEVEAILDYVKEEEGKELYEIKWKGWSMQHNTWEPRANLLCEELLTEFHLVFDKYGKEGILQKHAFDLGHATKHNKLKDLMNKIMETQELTAAKLLKMQSPNAERVKRLSQRVRRKPVMPSITNRRGKAYKQLKEDQVKRLKEWETSINRINTDPAPITVENKVDLEGPPSQFVYMNKCKAMEGIDLPEDPIVGCECTNCLETKKQCCGPNAGAEFAYLKSKRVRVPPGHPIYECNKRCRCTETCPNRVVQLGRKHKVCIFRTDNGRGWGVRALQKIPKGSFVMEYVGEVITFEEAERRGHIYDAEGMTYLFDLDYNDGDCPFTVDARSYGNVSHFVNHSCDPNLAVYGVWINTLDPRLPRIALFAKKDIEKFEELTFDYMMTGATDEADIMPDKDIDEISIDVSETESVALSSSQQDENKEPVSESAQSLTTTEETIPMETKTPEAMATEVNPTVAAATAAVEGAEDLMEVVSSTQPIVISDMSESEAETRDEAGKKPLQDASVTQSTQAENVLKEVSTNIQPLSSQEEDSQANTKLLSSVDPLQVSPITKAKFVVIEEKFSAEDSIENMDSVTTQVANDADNPLPPTTPVKKTPVKTPPTRVNLTPRKDLTRSAERGSFNNRRSAHCPPPAMKYRLMCQCGASNCRKYLY